MSLDTYYCKQTVC